MGCGSSKAAESQSVELRKAASKRGLVVVVEDLNKLGGHAVNATKDSMVGVLSLRLGDVKGLKNRSHGRVYAVVTFGQQTFKTGWAEEDQDKKEWDDYCHIWIQEFQLKSKVLISVYDKDRKLIGLNYVTVEELMAKPKPEDRTNVPVSCLLFPENTFRGQEYKESDNLGKFEACASYSTREELIKGYWKWLFDLADPHNDGALDMEAFREMFALKEPMVPQYKDAKRRSVKDNVGDTPPPTDAVDVFKKADANADGKVTVEELSDLMVSYPHLCTNIMLYSYQCEHVQSESGQGVQGGFHTRDQASAGWAFKTSEWLGMKDYSVGINAGADAAFILVWDLENGVILQEKISAAINTAMRAMYQTKAGRLSLLLPSTTKLMEQGSIMAGRKEDHPKSKAKIPHFCEAMAINTSEIRDPMDSFKTFNEFFTRHLKPEARPISEPENARRAVQPCDSRLNVFKDITTCMQFWVKGKQFSLDRLLGCKALAADFEGGGLAICRLAPQDYHRFHAPVDGKVVYSGKEIGKEYYTVNPVAINSPVNVLTENKRKVHIIDSPQFGKVAFVCVGATMVGTIVTTGLKEGNELKRGDDMGTYKFGGSTCVMVFQKGAIEFDQVLLMNSEKSLETLVKMGCSLGVCTRQ
mmetsp:Transcript_34361/g.75167  ORF Transcript_34361/g.75167 Transcript_34361/m.75167 type:complete len:640 (-) Transcript_34361:228-2147(-)